MIGISSSVTYQISRRCARILRIPSLIFYISLPFFLSFYKFRGLIIIVIAIYFWHQGKYFLLIRPLIEYFLNIGFTIATLLQIVFYKSVEVTFLKDTSSV